MFALISWEASRELLGGRFEAFGGRFGANCRFAPPSPSWAPLGAVLGVTFGVLERSLGAPEASWAVLAASWAPPGPSWGPLGSERVMREDVGSPEGFWQFGFQLPNIFLRT